MNILIASTLLTASAEGQHWTPQTMLQMKVISDVQLAPDNQAVLFVATENKLGEEKGIALSTIYKGNRDNQPNTPLVAWSDKTCTHPRWSPDGKKVAFLSLDAGKNNLYLIGSEGGEATPLTKSDKGVQSFMWSPDGTKIAFVMPDEKKGNPKKSSQAYVYGNERIVQRLWVVDIQSLQLTPLTDDTFFVRGFGDFGTINAEFDWSPDSNKIAFAYSPGPGFDFFYLDSSIAVIDLTKKQIVAWEKKARFEGMPRFSPDGAWVGYLSDDSPTVYAMNRRVAVRTTEGQKQRLLATTFNGGPLLAGANLLGWNQEGNGLIFYEAKGTKFHLVFLPVDGSKAKEIEIGKHFIREPALSRDRTSLGFVLQSPNTPPEAYAAAINAFKPTQVSTLNQQFLSYPKFKTEVISWHASDGKSIEGLLTYPQGYEQGKKYPLLLVVHGGPMGFFDETYLGTPLVYPLAAFAEAGFLLLRPNPRGSTGYGSDFRTANYGDWGGKDFDDLMTGIDHVIEQGMADGDRLGIMGWSYGGYMTAWAITQTDRFKKASMGAGLSNLVSMNGTTDLHRFLTDFFGDYSRNREIYEERSPINHVAGVKTPCLIQHGTADLRVPDSQGQEFYQALKRQGKQAELVLYPEMVHRLSDPNMLLDAMERNFAWFQ